MYAHLFKYRIATILPFEQSSFHNAHLTPKLKLSKELITLNFSKFAPFNNPYILKKQEKETLYIWFYKEKKTEPIVIPESYILFKEIREKLDNQIIVFTDTLLKVIVIVNNQLVDAFTMESLDMDLLHLSMDENNIQQYTLFTKTEYETLLQDAKAHLSIQDFLAWNQFELDRNKLIELGIERLSYPLTALAIIYVLLDISHTYLLEEKVKQLTDTYKTLRDENSKIKYALSTQDTQQEHWQQIKNEELIFPDTLYLVDTIIKNLKDENITITQMQFNGAIGRLILKTSNNPVDYLNKLSDIPMFTNITIANTRKDGPLKTVTYELTVKPLSELE